MDHALTLSVIVFTVAAIWLFYRRTKNEIPITHATAAKPLESLFEVIDTTPDKPISFGYKNLWLAIRSGSSQDVIQSLPIDNLQPANWQTGFVAAYNGHTFVAPPVEGWVFVVSRNLPELGCERDAEEWRILLKSLSEKYGEAQYFGTHRVVGYNAWARFKNGTEERAFAYSGESGETLVDRGARTSDEIELGLNHFEPSSPDAETEAYYPDEDHVMEVAGKWSVNPNTLESKDLAIGVGWIGNIRRVRNSIE